MTQRKFSRIGILYQSLCLRLILRPQDVILSPDAKGAMKEFCSQYCLTSFNYKKNAANYSVSTAAKNPPQTRAPQSLCSMCTRYCIVSQIEKGCSFITSVHPSSNYFLSSLQSKHEVILNGAVHKLCSDACFTRFRTVNNLSMAGCANCSSYCHSKPVLLKLEGSSKTLCNAECLAKYKEVRKQPTDAVQVLIWHVWISGMLR